MIVSKVAQLVDKCGPVTDARAMSTEQLVQAVAEARGMLIWTDRAMGSQEAGLSTIVAPGGSSPDIVFARPIPTELRQVAEPEWRDHDDIRRALGLPIAPPFRRAR